ncbi:hypothetical protein K505DRAFT_288605 [Melanomma pulvis-pyrius CBS 109.77]|uniref:Uncharacterized protein n=1 Tax=Melanomma pulvis-pyrius CBS 109.77 TaxID=1314802 RepID=A0A6A6WTD2_9PLEO|nr:hypothetical protein K505DRAFT_288605 [Melanomma pulvis-pyrius CBS 109.77]
MSIPQAVVAQDHLTPPSSFTDEPLTPPLTDKRPFDTALRVIELFRQIQAGRNPDQGTLVEFQLGQAGYDALESALEQDHVLSGYVKDKIRYDYDGDKGQLVVRMPTGVHEVFIDRVEDEIRSQLKAIRSGTGRKAQFAQKVQPARSTEIRFPTSASSSKSKYEPDASFWHDDTQYPGVIIEVSYSQNKKRLGRLAENYLIDSDANVRAVVGLDIVYGEKGSRKATLSIWRPRLFDTADGPELRTVQEVKDEAFRDDDGNPTNHPGLRLRLSDFAFEELARREMGDEDVEISISGIQLCKYLVAAERKVRRAQSLLSCSSAPEVKKRKRSETPPEEITSGDEARYVADEERAAKRTLSHDDDYIDS